MQAGDVEGGLWELVKPVVIRGGSKVEGPCKETINMTWRMVNRELKGAILEGQEPILSFTSEPTLQISLFG